MYVKICRNALVRLKWRVLRKAGQIALTRKCCNIQTYSHLFKVEPIYRTVFTFLMSTTVAPTFNQIVLSAWYGFKCVCGEQVGTSNLLKKLKHTMCLVTKHNIQFTHSLTVTWVYWLYKYMVSRDIRIYIQIIKTLYKCKIQWGWEYATLF